MTLAYELQKQSTIKRVLAQKLRYHKVPVSPLLGFPTVGATVSIPFTYAKSFNPAEARYQDRKSEQNVTAIAHPS